MLAAAWLFGAFVATACAQHISKSQLRSMQAEAAQRWRANNEISPDLLRLRRSEQRSRRMTFQNPKAAEFLVDGKSIPEVDFDVGPSYSGLLPISGDQSETRKLFFWFFPPGPQGSQDDLIFWTNGGPGCSSLAGLLQENGPISWSWGQAKPTENEFSWTNLSSVLWVEQPVGTGFSQGQANIDNEDDLAKQVVGFMQQFLNVFSELKGKKLYLTGESYAGMYIPYIANYIYENPTALDLSLQGIWLGGPAFGWDAVAIEAPAVNFVHKYENIFGFNQSFMQQLDQRAESCHYTDYLQKYISYPPPPAPFPLPGSSVEFDDGCDVWSDIVGAALLLNPAFNVYRVYDVYPVLWDVLGFPGTFPQIQVDPVYFNRDDVKRAIHAPVETQWTECIGQSHVFTAAGDTSTPAAYTVLPNVIEKSQRSVIVHGLGDFSLIAEGTRIILQNMTWNGKQGFQSALQTDSFVIDGVGAAGNVQSERGLTYYEAKITGHMIPQFNPKAAYQSMQYLLGFRNAP
ncbi:alpha/beta-hydrolase [Dentipellis sp. KUC8613]|nr:alpha/beta-hydrolase [Dentipellis sp. KUC8613]